MKHSQILREAGAVLQQQCHRQERVHTGHQQRLWVPAAGAYPSPPSLCIQLLGLKKSWGTFRAHSSSWEGRTTASGPQRSGSLAGSSSEGGSPDQGLPWGSRPLTALPVSPRAGPEPGHGARDGGEAPALRCALSGVHILRRISRFCSFHTEMLQGD